MAFKVADYLLVGDFLHILHLLEKYLPFLGSMVLRAITTNSKVKSGCTTLFAAHLTSVKDHYCSSRREPDCRFARSLASATLWEC